MALTMSVATTLANEGLESLDEHKELVESAVVANDVDALSMLLKAVCGLPKLDEAIEAHGTKLLKLAMRSNDAADCTVYLLNHLEGIRRQKEAAAPQKEFSTLMKMGPADFIADREVYCGKAPSSSQLMALAREALSPISSESGVGDATAAEPAEDGRGALAPRCGRALLLHAHRLRKVSPKVGQPLLGADNLPLKDSNGQPCVPWPRTPSDLPKELTAHQTPHGGMGGCDLSLGGEAVPLQWINEVDHTEPPAIVFVRRAIDADVCPDWGAPSKRAKCCTNRQQLDKGHRCADISFKWGGPDGFLSECNWACCARSSCDAQCPRRSLQRGAAHRLQVFKDPLKGWCLRTLTPIKEGAFVMEYAAERVSSSEAAERAKDDPNVETFLMDIAKADMHLDALVVRNHAAFASFACTRKLANMHKEKVWTQHWDPKVPHAAFFATRDIEPGEELSYLRTNCEQKSHRVCKCQSPNCSGFV
jgi:hypothetical protein